MKKILYSLLFCIIGLQASISASAAAENFKIESIKGALPNIEATIISSTEPNKKITLSFEDREIKADSVKKYHNNGVKYFALIDISGSISDTQFENMKTTLKNFAQTLTVGDEFILIPIGAKNTDPLLIGNEGLKKRIKIIDELKNKGQSTNLYDAIYETANFALKDIESKKRGISFVITDGDDVTFSGNITKNESLKKLKDSSLPLYAFGLNSGSDKGLDTLGEISRTSGGDFIPVSARNFLTLFESKIDDILKNAYKINFIATDTAIKSGQYQFIIKSDNSAEKHYGNIAGVNKEPEKTALQKIMGFWWIALIIALIAIVLILLLITRKYKGAGLRKKTKEKKNLGKSVSAKFVLLQHNGVKVIPIEIQESFFVGRGKGNDLSFNDNTMSGQHFVIEKSEGIFEITDLNTKNETRVNGVPLRNKIKLRFGDKIEAGSQQLIFEREINV